MLNESFDKHLSLFYGMQGERLDVNSIMITFSKKTFLQSPQKTYLKMALVNFAGSSGRKTIIHRNFFNKHQTDKYYLNTKGDGMQGVLDMNENRIIDVSKPENATDAVNKHYVDTEI